MSLAIAMHALLLAVLGPLGLGYNRVVWSWNAVMIVVLVVLFRRSGEAGPRQILWPRLHLQAVVVVLFWLLPALSYAGLWPRYFAFRLYSHDQDQGGVFVTREVLERMPAATQASLVRYPLRRYVGYFEIGAWSERELGAFVPSEPRLYRKIAAKVCALAARPDDVMLSIQGPPHGRAPRRHAEYFCGDL
jgi:hypothetical protein